MCGLRGASGSGDPTAPPAVGTASMPSRPQEGTGPPGIPVSLGIPRSLPVPPRSFPVPPGPPRSLPVRAPQSARRRSGGSPRQPPAAPSRGTLGEPPVPREPSDGRGKAHPRRWEKPVLVQQPRARLRTANRALGSSPARPLFCVISSGSCVTPGVFAAARLAAVGAGRSLHPSRPQDTSRPGGAGQRGGKGWEGMGSGAEASRGVNAS